MKLNWQENFQPGPAQGLFLSFEGIEGAGKSTQIKELTNSLQEQGKNVLCVREPGGTRFGEKLRQAILHSTRPLHPYSEALLFASSRGQLLHEKIIPHLKKPDSVVICDRYIDSSLAYQGYAREFGMDKIIQIHSHYPLTILPDLTFYIDISVECSYERQTTRNDEKDYFEKEKIEFYQRLKKGYDIIAQSDQKRIQVIDGEQTIEQIQNNICEKLKTFIQAREK